MKELVLLGAGASAEAGVPTAFDMTGRMLERIAQDASLSELVRVIRFALGGLIFQKGIKGEDPLAGVDIEELFNAIDLISQRESLEAAAFIGNWHPIIDELDKITPPPRNIAQLAETVVMLVTDSLSNALKDSRKSYHQLESDIDFQIEYRPLRRSDAPSQVGEAVTALIKAVTDEVVRLTPRSDRLNPHIVRTFEQQLYDAMKNQPQPGRGKIFKRTAESLRRMLKDLAWIDASDTARVDYLLPLVKYCDSTDTRIATINYDNTIERAASYLSIPCDTMVADPVSNAGAVKQGIKLLKLHGSVDWQETDGPRNATLPEKGISLITEEHMRSLMAKSYYNPAIIFGHRNKLTAEGPFLDLLYEFNSELRKSDRLTIIGYSFRDDHLNALITKWFNRNPNCVLRIYNKSFHRCNRKYLDQLSLVERKRVELTSKTLASEAIKGLFGST